MHEVSKKEMAQGRATGVSVKFDDGQFCFIATDNGVLGCGIFDINIFNEAGYAGAIMRGTEEKPYVEPEDLLEGKVSAVSDKAREMGIEVGMHGDVVLKKLLGDSA